MSPGPPVRGLINSMEDTPPPPAGMRMMKTAVILNPASGRRDGIRLWARLLSRFPGETKHLVTWTTRGPGHAEVLAAKARRRGFDRVIAAGGDGTLLEVVNGLWWESRGALPSVAMVSMGTGCDYLRSFRARPDPALELLSALRNPAVGVAVGVADLKSLDGGAIRRVFLNVVGAGFDGNVALRLQRGTKPKLGKASYVVGLLRELLALKPYRLEGTLDDQALEVESVMMVACLGRYFGGGMMIGPEASPLADHFQVLWSHGAGPLELLGLLPGIYRGKHLDHPSVRSCSAQHLRVDAAPPAPVEAEGEPIGWTPLSVRILPRALSFVPP